nr:unnamed protein product [Spirometra erinaceieuropaei]
MPGKINVAKCPISETLKDLVDGGPCNPLQMLRASQIILLAIFGISCLGSLLAGLFKLGKYLKCEGKIGWITEGSFSLTRFAKFVGVFLLLGLLTVRKNSKASLLDVNVTTEIKGWMQIGILAYHYTDAYFILPIFIVIRLFVSMYVVLSAYGHFCYYWRKNYLQEEEMLKLPVCRRVCICLKRLLYRYIQVLFRMNFLVLLLCPIFQQPYMKYYFVPLIATAYTLSAGTMTAWMFLLFLVELSCCRRLKDVSIPASELPVMVRLKAAREFVEKHRKDICFLLVLSLAGLYSLLLNTSTSLFSYTFFRRPLIYLAPGEDCIPAEIFKSSVDTPAPWLHEVIERAWRDEVAPDDWGLGILVPILKKTKTRCENYRDICLIDVAAEIFAVVLLRRFQAVRDLRMRPNQAGFRVGHGCADQIFTLRRILEFRHSYQQPTAVCFVDFAAAFYSVHRESLWRIMR